MNAVVLTFDCLPIRLLGCYGNQRIATANFDRLASDAIVFDAHFGENFDTAAMNHAWWTGRYQFPRSPVQQSRHESFGRRLSEAGVALHIISDPSAVTGRPDQTPFGQLVEAAVKRIEEVAAESGSSQLLWLKATGFNLPDPKQDSNTARKAYSRSISALDQELGKLLEAVAECGAFGDLLFMLTSSQGADLGERAGRTSPSILLSEAMVHVPLIIRVPNGEMGSRRACLTQSVDILPTLLEWFGVDAVRYALEGRSLLPMVLGTAIDEREHVCLGIGDRERAIRTRDFYLVERGWYREPFKADAENDAKGSHTAYLFKKPGDRFDIHDVAQQFPGVCDQLRRSLEEFATRMGSSVAG